jgi:hypothetical protein
MPDIQTEMQKLLKTWEEPYPQTEQPKGPKLFAPTNNVSQQTFNFIRDNAGCARTYVIRTLVNQGHKKSSVSSLVGQMLRQGHIYTGSDGTLYANGKEYMPIKSAKTIANREKKLKVKTSTPTKKYKTKEVPVPAGIASLVEEHKERVERDEVKHIMNTISLPDAKRLYNSLATYFNTL